MSCDDLATHTPQVLGIVQVLADTQIRRRKTISYNVEGKSSDNNNLGARKKIIISHSYYKEDTVKYVIILTGCLMLTYGWHKLLNWLKSLDESSMDPNDNW